ncbi:MAG: serine/threonine-protein kinase, partial [Myxococcota bacterium]
MELQTGQEIDSYRVIAPIGRGSLGAVYLAEHMLIGHNVAIKVLSANACQDRTLVKRYFNEARAASLLLHPSMVPVHDVRKYGRDRAYTIMPYLRGETLDAHLRRHYILSVSRALTITRQIVDALFVAHANYIVHRGLQSNNVLLVDEPAAPGGRRVKLLDFGLARLRELSGPMLSLYGSNVPPWLHFVSPEQCRGYSEIDCRSDLYMVGCLLYQMLCGQPPFAAGSAERVVHGHLHERPRAPQTLNPSIPYDLDVLIRRLLAKQPD